MIVFINGGFGVGKTTAALHLRERIAPSLLYDPEEIGFAIRAILRDVVPADDFQDYPEWRALTIDAVRQLRAHRDHALLMPMTDNRTPAEVAELALTAIENQAL